MDWLSEVCGYGNGHEIFHIVQKGLTKEAVENAIVAILGEDGFAGDGILTETGASFSTAKENVFYVTQRLSELFPNAVCFGQDAWDYEGLVVCYEHGSPSNDYKARCTNIELVEEGKDYYDLCVEITSNGYTFYAGGGMCHIDELRSLGSFLNHTNPIDVVSEGRKAVILNMLDDATRLKHKRLEEVG